MVEGPRWLNSADITIAEEVNIRLPIGQYITQNQITEDGEDVHSVIELILILENYSSLNKLLRITAWKKRFVHSLRNTEKSLGELCAQEIEAAEKYWIRLTQIKCFSKEMKQLETKKGLDRISKIHTLKPFLDEGKIM